MSGYRGLDWNLLHTFLTIVEAGSITRAADRLLLRQPTVSSALKRLEEQIGYRLIERGPAHFEVTERGRLLYRECRTIRDTVERLPARLADSEAELSGHLRIVLASHVVFPPFDQVLAEFHARYPNVTMELEIKTSSQVAQKVLSREATCGICLVSQPHPRLDYRIAFREYFGFFCGPGHRLFGRKRLRLSDLRGENFVSFDTDRLTDALRPVAILRETQRLNGRIIAKSSNLEEVRRLIIAGLGIGPLPLHVVERDVRDGLLWRLPPYDDPPPIDIYLVSHPQAQLTLAERRLLERLHAKLDAAPSGHYEYLSAAPAHSR